jgi:hypothetical protein
MGASIKKQAGQGESDNFSLYLQVEIELTINNKNISL